MSLIATEPYTLSDAAKKFVDEVNRQWEDVDADLATSDEKKLLLDTADPLTLDVGKSEKARGVWRAERIAIIRAMITTIRRLEKWPAMRRGERARAYTAAIAKVREAREEVARRLESIGFEDVDPEAELVGYHPLVTAAAELLVTIDNMRHAELDLSPYQRQLDAAQAALRELVGVPVPA